MTTVIDSSINERIVLPLGVSTSFTDLIRKNDNQSVDIESAKFFMRLFYSREPTIEGGITAEVINLPGENVKVELSSEDLSIEGEYFAWWSIKVSGREYETPEFPIIVSDHGPGIGVQIGAIVEGASKYMPTTVDALKKSSTFGERRMQEIATLIQLRMLKEAVSPDQEIVAYELPLLDYFSKRVALELCAPGIEYWSRQYKTSTFQNPGEITSYPEIIKTIENLRDWLIGQLEENWRELSFFVPELKQRKAVSMPGSSLEFYERPEQNGTLRRRQEPLGFVTRDPNTMQRLETGWRGNFDLFTLGFWPFP